MQNITIPPCYYRISVKALIINEKMEFLLIKEENWLWDFPGWWLDYDENIEAGIRREIKEEMWLEVTFLETSPSYFLTTKSLRGKPIANIFYKTTVENLIFTPSNECVEIGFFTIETARHQDTYPNVQEFLKYYNPNNHGNR